MFVAINCENLQSYDNNLPSRYCEILDSQTSFQSQLPRNYNHNALLHITSMGLHQLLWVVAVPTIDFLPPVIMAIIMAITTRGETRSRSILISWKILINKNWSILGFLGDHTLHNHIQTIIQSSIMKSSHGNDFYMTDPLQWESTGDQW